MDEQQSIDMRSFIQEPISRPLSHTPSQSINFAELARIYLRQYEDVNQGEFVVIEEQDNENYMKNSQIPQQNYMKLHNTIVPIGPTYQAHIPPIMSSLSYRNRNHASLQRLHSLKVHDPVINPNFYQLNNHIITLSLGERSYDEVCLIWKCYKEYPQEFTFQEYISNKQILNFWADYFHEKSRLNILKKKKKKKSKGSIPT